MKSKEKTSRQDLINDAHNLIQIHGKLTRDLYRKKGQYKESLVYKFFPSFSDFIAALGANSESVEKNTFTDDTWTIDLKKTRIHTIDQLLEAYQVDLSVWDVTKCEINKWEVGRKDRQVDWSVSDGIANGTIHDSGKIFVEPLYQVKATLVKRKAVVDARLEIEKLKADLKAETPFKKTKFSKKEQCGNMLEITVPDAHFGKMAWSKETGYQSYDTPIAAAMFLRALDTLIESAKAKDYDKILFVVGNDLLNSDNEQGTTTKGTAVSTDGRYQKTFITVRRTITEAIKRLKEIAPVHVVMISGNHDDLGVWHLGDSLECAFANDEDVEIDNEPKYRKYVRYGKVLLMFTHGDKGKREDYPLLMATEKSKDFGETKYREVHTGHIHQTKLQEWHGVRVRILPSLSPPDAWHSENGFTGQQRNAEAYVWNYERGLTDMHFYNDDAYPEISTDRILREG
jgi:hypothetical protein